MRISHKQARQRSEIVAERQAWLSRVVARLEKTVDPLLGAAIRARDGMAALRMAVYYDSAPSGAGRPEEFQSQITSWNTPPQTRPKA